MKASRKKAPFGGRLIVVGGQCRKVGKTALVVDLLRAFPSMRWVAVKITPYAEAGCPVRGSTCKCAPNRHTFAIRVDKDRTGESDTSRFLAAGAERALWVQTKDGRVADGLAALAAKLSKAENVIVESDAIIKFWQPDLYLMVLDPRNDDFKTSAWAGLRVADGFVYRSPTSRGRGKGNRTAGDGLKSFVQHLGWRLPERLRQYVMRHLVAAKHLS